MKFKKKAVHVFGVTLVFIQQYCMQIKSSYSSPEADEMSGQMVAMEDNVGSGCLKGNTILFLYLNRALYMCSE